MVKDTGKALHAGASHKSLNTPDRIRVEEDTAGRPAAIRIKRRMTVERVDDFWRLDDEWWRPRPVSRFYYAIRLATGQRTVIYKDLLSGDWYRQSY